MVTPVISEFLKKVEERRESKHFISEDIRACLPTRQACLLWLPTRLSAVSFSIRVLISRCHPDALKANVTLSAAKGLRSNHSELQQTQRRL